MATRSRRARRSDDSPGGSATSDVTRRQVDASAVADLVDRQAPVEHARLQSVQRTAGNQAAGRLLAGGRTPARAAPTGTPAVQRRVGDAHVAWGQQVNTQLERIQDAVKTARDNLNQDADAAVEALREVRSEYRAFEQRYDAAAEAVREGISAASARQAQIDAGLSSALDLVLFAAGGPWVSAARATVRTLRAVSTVKSYVDALGHAGTVGAAASGAQPAGTDPLSRIPVRSRHIDWDAAMGFALDAFDRTVEQQDHLNGIDDRCDNHIRFIGTVRDRTYEGDDPRADRHGQSAAAMAEAAAEILQRLAVFRPGVVSRPVGAFRDAAVGPLQGRTRGDLERGITLRLIAGLSYSEAAERNGVIRGGKDYLRQIGLIDENGNMLSFDSGWSGWITDAGAQVIRQLAQSETGAMSLVGGTARWRGGLAAPVPGVPLVGLIETGSHGPSISAPGSRRTPSGTWNAVAPAGSGLQPGDTVQIVSYTTDRSERTKWTSHGQRTRREIDSEVTFRVRPR